MRKNIRGTELHRDADSGGKSPQSGDRCTRVWAPGEVISSHGSQEPSGAPGELGNKGGGRGTVRRQGLVTITLGSGVLV